MNPHEIDRLGWSEFRGLPIIPDSAMGTGCFQIRCPGQDHYSDSQQTPETEPLKEVAV